MPEHWVKEVVKNFKVDEKLVCLAFLTLYFYDVSAG